jgi:hypothetical protein
MAHEVPKREACVLQAGVVYLPSSVGMFAGLVAGLCKLQFCRRLKSLHGLVTIDNQLQQQQQQQQQQQ